MCEKFMLSEIVFVINAPPLSLKKPDLYDSEFTDSELSTHIKSISDSFFLSNQFRKHYIVYFLTEISGDSYIIEFKGNELRFLGPSFFSAGHLLLRAKNHIMNPDSKNGKLTPGIRVYKRDIGWIFEKYKESKWFQVINTLESTRSHKIDLNSKNVFFFGFGDNVEFNKEIFTLSLGFIEMDEQIIILNHILESGN